MFVAAGAASGTVKLWNLEEGKSMSLIFGIHVIDIVTSAVICIP